MADAPPTRQGGTLLVELIRLAVVVLATVAAFELASLIEPLRALRADSDIVLLSLTALGAACGYVVGGVFGRFTLGRIDLAERNLRSVPVVDLVAATLGACAGLVLTPAFAWPLLLFDNRAITVPLAALAALVLVGMGARVGAARGGDLLRFVGASGRLDVARPTHGPGAKLVDTSALVDGRVVDVCRSGFLEGTLVVPRFVLYELQGLADAEDEQRRARGRRGLDVLAALQRSSGVAVEVTDRDHPDVDTVDAKLVSMARERGAGLITVDGNLGRVAEVQGVKVLNLHTLADDLRPPVLPGDDLRVRVLKPGKEAGQGVGYLADGTMVVVEGGRDRRGEDVHAEVTSILSTSNGRMVFATLRDPTPRLVSSAAGGE